MKKIVLSSLHSEKKFSKNFKVCVGSGNMSIALRKEFLDSLDYVQKKIGFQYIRGHGIFSDVMGVDLKEKGIVQVSINMTDYTKTSLYRVFEMVKFEAQRYGVSVVSSEIVGLTPMEALLDAASYYMQLEDFSLNQVIEYQIMK